MLIRSSDTCVVFTKLRHQIRIFTPSLSPYPLPRTRFPYAELVYYIPAIPYEQDSNNCFICQKPIRKSLIVTITMPNACYHCEAGTRSHNHHNHSRISSEHRGNTFVRCRWIPMSKMIFQTSRKCYICNFLVLLSMTSRTLSYVTATH